MGTAQHYMEHILSNSILVSTPEYTLIRFHCPIAAVCLQPIAGMTAGLQVWIDGIYHHSDQRMTYLIDGLQLPYNYFQITQKPDNHEP